MAPFQECCFQVLSKEGFFGMESYKYTGVISWIQVKLIIIRDNHGPFFNLNIDGIKSQDFEPELNLELSVKHWNKGLKQGHSLWTKSLVLELKVLTWNQEFRFGHKQDHQLEQILYTWNQESSFVTERLQLDSRSWVGTKCLELEPMSRIGTNV